MIGKLQAPPWFGTAPQFGGVLETLKRHRLVSIGTAVALIVAIVAGSLAATRANTSAAYQTQPVVQQDLSQTVTASGTVNPQNTVSVGTQVSGTISSIYVDYNSKVKKGQVLAKIDTSQLQAQLEQAQAALAQARAQAAAQVQTAGGAQSSIVEAQANSAAQSANAQAAQAGIATANANVTKAQSALQVAQQTLSRDKSLLSQGYISQSQFDTDQSSEVSAGTALKSAQAAVVQAQAQAAASVSQAQASAAQSDASISAAAASADTAQAGEAAVEAAQAQVAQDQLNISHAVITSPVDGTVIARDIDVGQTVAASLQTPTLFSIAQDLKKMEVDIAVGEPDIGNVRPGDPVSFSVLAYPNQTFTGSVSQVRENPTTVSNVVTYTVITDVANPQNQLLPGMTANATITVNTAHNALVVPTQALAFRPAGGAKSSHKFRKAYAAQQNSTAQSSSASGASTASPWGQTQTGASANVTAGGTGLLFVLQNGKAMPVRVKIDLVSNAQAAVTPVNGSLAAGDAVILSNGSPSTSQHGTSTHPASAPGPGGPGGAGGLGRAIR